MTSILIAFSCICINLMSYFQGILYMDSIGGFVSDFSKYNEEKLYISIPSDKLDDFSDEINHEIDKRKVSFSYRGWIATFIVTCISGFVAYYVSGKSLKPLKEFSKKIEEIEMSNITDSLVSEDEVLEFRNLSHSFNNMLKRLEDSFEEQGQFTANAAHELRTPLALMQTQLDLIKKNKDMTFMEFEKNSKTFENQLDRLSKLTKVLLQMSEISTIKRNEKIDLYPLIEEVMEDLSYLADEKNISMEIEGDGGIILGSDILIYRVFFNLIENAIKYNREDGYIKIKLKRDEDKINIEISDNGIEIPKEFRDKIFKAFFRVNKSSSVSGSGLGLCLVDKIINLHNGKVFVKDSNKDKTTIGLELKLIK